jgi:hypothetical protein
MSVGLDSRSQARLTRALWAARAVMLWEQGARVWAPWLLAAAALAVAALWGLFELAGPIGRVMLVTGAGLAAVVASVRGALAIRWPSRGQTRARLEADSRLVHAPLTALEDARAAGDPALWELHRKAAAAAVAQTRVGRPKAGLAVADPLALRYALMVAAALALWARGPERVQHLPDAFAPPERLADLDAGVAAAKTQADAVARSIAGLFAAKGEAHAETRAGARAD